MRCDKLTPLPLAGILSRIFCRSAVRVFLPIGVGDLLGLETKMRLQRNKRKDWVAVIESLEEKVHALKEAGVCAWCTPSAGTYVLTDSRCAPRCVISLRRQHHCGQAIMPACSIHSFLEMRERARQLGPKRVAVVMADDLVALAAVQDAWQLEIAIPVLIGDETKIRSLAAVIGIRRSPAPSGVCSNRSAGRRRRQGWPAMAR